MKKHTYHRLLFLGAAIITMAVAEVSFFPGILPVFSSHMAGHILLLLIAAPLAVLAMAEKPEAVGGLAFSISRRLATIPWMNWVIGVGILWVWHIPALFNNLIAVENRTIHGHIHFLSFLHSGSLLLSGVLFCWPLAGPFKSHRLRASESMLYLTTGFVACSLLALLIGFARPGLYGGAVPLLRGDQQSAALIMWVPVCLMYLGSVIYLLRKWMGEGLWKSNEFYRQSRRRTKVTDHQQPAQNDGYLGRGEAVVPQMGVPDPLEAV